MNLEINARIERALQGIARLRKIDSTLKQLELEQENLGSQERELEVILAKENKDVLKLENTSLASLFYSILGNLDKQVEKERREALAAKLKYDQLKKDLEDVQDQIAKLSAERLEYLPCQKEFDGLYAQKKAELLWENGAAAQTILKLTDSIHAAKIALIEIHEALAAGNEVLAALENVSYSLEKAEGWGTWDLLGGGFISGLAKHSHIDDAKAETENTQRLLRRFRTELADIRIRTDIVIETDGFAKFADFFFDGLIADWFMQSKIHQSKSGVTRVKDQVSDVLAQLEQLKAEENSTIQRLETEIQELILKA